MFSTLSEKEIIISATLISSSANAFYLDLSKILPFGKELSKQQISRLVPLKNIGRKQFTYISNYGAKCISSTDGKSATVVLYHMTNFRHFQTERVCRRQF